MPSLQQRLRELATAYALDTFQMRGALIEAAGVLDIQDQELAHIRRERNELAQHTARLRAELNVARQRGFCG